MGISERKLREKKARRELFVDVAERLFFELGYDGASVEQIARQAEFSKRTIYLYFADKRELYLAVVLRGLKLLQQRLAGAANEDRGTGAERLNALAKAYFDFALEFPDYFAAILSFESEEYRWGRSTEDLGANAVACLEVNDHNTRAVHRLIDDGQADGTIRSSLDSAQLTLVIWAQLLGVVQVVSMRRDSLESLYGLDATAFFDAFLALMQHGIYGSGVDTDESIPS